jgi:hypothetical protein
MAPVASRPRQDQFAVRLRGLLERGLGKAGIKAKVEVQRVPTTRLHRVLVVAEEFGKLRPSERQDLVWRIVGDDLSRDEQLRISMILTLSQSESAGS